MNFLLSLLVIYMTTYTRVTAHMSKKLKILMDRAREVTGESQSAFIRKSITVKLEQLSLISTELKKESGD